MKKLYTVVGTQVAYIAGKAVIPEKSYVLAETTDREIKIKLDKKTIREHKSGLEFPDIASQLDFDALLRENKGDVSKTAEEYLSILKGDIKKKGVGADAQGASSDVEAKAKAEAEAKAKAEAEAKAKAEAEAKAKAEAEAELKGKAKT